tara:strand:- start:150 stop:1919 length:1770 start_codon:yes stop_codon:yes gene_type:complete
MRLEGNLFSKPSVSGMNWIYTESEKDDLVLVKKKLNISNSIANIILNRYPRMQDLDDLLNTSLKDNIPNPKSLKDLELAVDLVYKSLSTKAKIGILGDYDVDGCTSAALIHDYFFKIGINTTVYIPDRIKDGYGVSKRSLDYFCDKKIELLITLDCGSNDYETISYARNKGIKVIVIDHHEIKKKAKAYSIINPKQDDDKSNLNHLSTVGLCFIFVLGLQDKLLRSNYFKIGTMPDLRYFLDIVALGTVCDLVPIKGLNRIFVKKGLDIINKKIRHGLSILVEKLDLSNKITESDLAYYLGPCINAAGRIGNSYNAFQFLSNNTNTDTDHITDELIRNNKERRTLEAIAINQAEEIIRKKNILSSNENMFILIENSSWHPGITGIIASRLLEKFKIPCFVISSYKSKSRGSVRTPYSIDASKILKRLLDLKVIVSGGGHKMAGGFVLNKGQTSLLREALLTELKKIKFSKIEALKIDSVTDISKINEKLIKDLDLIRPFGVENKEPTFVIKNVKPIYYNVIGKEKNHISCVLEDIYGLRLNAIAFDVLDNNIGETILKKNSVHIAGKIKINEWKKKKTIQFLIEDIIIL